MVMLAQNVARSTVTTGDHDLAMDDYPQLLP